MSPETLQILAIVFVAWGIAVALKAVNALRSGQAYEFAMWDGGMLRVGKRLTKLGMQIKVVVGVLMAFGCFALVTHILPLQTAAWGVVFVSIMSVVSDLVTTER